MNASNEVKEDERGENEFRDVLADHIVMSLYEWEAGETSIVGVAEVFLATDEMQAIKAALRKMAGDMDLSPWTTTMVLADYDLPASVIDWVLS